MQVDITLSDNNEDSTQGRESINDFQGVIYTRGSFHRKQPPCYLDPDDPSTIRSNNGRSFTLKFPLNKCQTLHVSRYHHTKDLLCELIEGDQIESQRVLN